MTSLRVRFKGNDVTADSDALCKAVVFLNHFKDLPDRRQRGEVVYPLEEVLLLALLGVLAGAESFVDIARFDCRKQDLLRRFRPFLHGTPSHDHFAALDAEQFQLCFVAWVASLIGVPRRQVEATTFTPQPSLAGVQSGVTETAGGTLNRASP